MDDRKDLNPNEDSEAVAEESTSPPVVDAATPETPEDPALRAEAQDDASEATEAPPETASPPTPEAPSTRRGWMRHPTKRVFGGVCGGLADFLGMSEGLVRLLFLALCLVSFGTALPLYLLFWLFLPQGTQEEGKTGNATIELHAKHGRWFAYGLIGVGAVILLVNIGVFDLMASLAHIILAPGILILIGFLILRKFHRKSLNQDIQNAQAGARKMSETASTWTSQGGKSRLGLYRSRDDKMVAGVCGGLGKALNVDPLLIRLAFVILGIVTAIVGMAVLYALLALLMPLEDKQNGDNMNDVSGSTAIEPVS